MRARRARVFLEFSPVRGCPVRANFFFGPTFDLDFIIDRQRWVEI